MDVLGLRVADIRTMVLSHGHADHHGGLEGLFRRVGRQRMSLVLHPDALREGLSPSAGSDGRWLGTRPVDLG